MSNEEAIAVNPRLPDIVCCPRCKGDLTRLDQVLTPSGRIVSCVLFCRTCDLPVGAVNDFRYDFLHFDADSLRQRAKRFHDRAPRVLPYEAARESIPYNDPRLDFKGAWEEWDSTYRMSRGFPEDEVAFSGEFLSVSARLLKHPWSGYARFIVDGEVVGEVDLYQPKWSTVTWFPIMHDLSPGPHTVRIIAVGKQNPLSSGTQLFFHELWITRLVNGAGAPAAATQDVNRTLDLPPEVIELMKDVPSDGLILDYGSGDRILADPRYVSLEYLPYQLPMVYADGQQLPFKDNVFDFLFSQAVLEHIPNPFTAVGEMRRIIKPGGLVWAGMAFMQPVHAVPYHYFNATAWGIEELFKDFEQIETSWFGELSYTIDWLCKAAEIPEQMDEAEYKELMEKIKSLDQLVSHDALRNVASGVALCGRKKYGA